MIVGVPARSLIGWGGGLDLIVSYVRALVKIQEVKVYVFIEKRPRWYSLLRTAYYRFLKNKKASQLAITENEAKALFETIVGKENVTVFNNVFPNSKKLDKIMKKKGVEVCFLDTSKSTLDISVPKVPYLFDFQYKYLSDLFKKEERDGLDLYFGELLDKAQAVIVEAEDVKKDVEKFFPSHRAKVFVMPYTAIPEKEWLEDDDGVLQKYGLPSRYFIISNQFWMHKDHKTAINALGLVKKEGHNDIFLVCTGRMEDDRNPLYFDELLDLCRENEVLDNVIFLGYIPKNDQIQIMKKSIAAIQPTRFEGNPGGGMGYNAISLKVPIILSDIAINQELIDSCVTFFETGNAIDLSNKMIHAINSDREAFSTEQLLELSHEREVKLQNSIYEALTYAISIAK